jgi:hypothetical protein
MFGRNDRELYIFSSEVFGVSPVWKSAIRGDMTDPTDDLPLIGDDTTDFGNLRGDISCLDRNPDNISVGFSASLAFSRNFRIC